MTPVIPLSVPVPTFALPPRGPSGTVSAFPIRRGPRVTIPYMPSPPSQAGFASPAADYVEDPLDLNDLLIRNPASSFCVRVKGNSMEEARIFDGDVLVVDRSQEARPGRIIVAAVDGSLYVKRMRVLSGRMALVSESPQSYPPIYLDEAVDCTLWGVVTGTVRSF